MKKSNVGASFTTIPVSSLRWKRAFTSLQNLHFRYFYFGQAVSLLGTSARTMAMGWLAFQLTNSSFQLGLVYTLNTLPILLLSIYAGSIADCFSKLSIFKVTSWFAMACSFAFALLIFFGKLNIGLLMAFTVLWGTAMAFEMPSRQSLMMDLVGSGNLVNVYNLLSTVFLSRHKSPFSVHLSRYYTHSGGLVFEGRVSAKPLKFFSC